MIDRDGELFFKTLLDTQWEATSNTHYRDYEDKEYLRKSDILLRDLIEGKPND
ncbi:MAG: hypothetical protein ACTHJ2_09575 [Candidatus Nitrosocosmicus sp.]